MKTPPKAILYIADLVRITPNSSKPDILGFLPGNSFAVTLTPESDEPSRNFPLGMKELCLYIWVQENIAGNPQKFQIIAPDGQSLFPEPLSLGNDLTIQPGALNLVLNLPGFPVVGFGVYEVNVTFSKHTFKFTFEIEQRISETGQVFKRPEIPTEVVVI